MDLSEIITLFLYFLVDFFLAVFLPMLACQVGVFTAKNYSINYGMEAMLILTCLIGLAIGLVAVIQSVISVLGEIARWAFMTILFIVNLFWTFYSIYTLIYTTKTWEADTPLGGTVFGIYLASLTFSLLKISGFVYLTYSVLAGAF